MFIIIACILLAVQSNAQTVGIDFGSNFVSFGLMRSGAPIAVVRNANGKTITPSLATVNGRERWVGLDAVQKASRLSRKTANNIIQLLGRNSLQNMSVYHTPGPTYLVDEERGSLLFETSKSELPLPVEDLAALILSEVQKIAAKSNNVVVKDVVITVPPYYSQSQRLSILDAARIAQLNVLGLIESNVAAAFQYGTERQRTMAGIFDEKTSDKDKKTSKERKAEKDSPVKEKTQPEEDLRSRSVVFVDMGGSQTSITLVHYEFPKDNEDEDSKDEREKLKEKKRKLKEDALKRKKEREEREKLEEENEGKESKQEKNDEKQAEILHFTEIALNQRQNVGYIYNLYEDSYAAQFEIEDEEDELLVSAEDEQEDADRERRGESAEDDEDNSITISSQADLEAYMKKQEDRERKRKRKDEKIKRKEDQGRKRFSLMKFFIPGRSKRNLLKGIVLEQKEDLNNNNQQNLSISTQQQQQQLSLNQLYNEYNIREKDEFDEYDTFTSLYNNTKFRFPEDWDNKRIKKEKEKEQEQERKNVREVERNRKAFRDKYIYKIDSQFTAVDFTSSQQSTLSQRQYPLTTNIFSIKHLKDRENFRNKALFQGKMEVLLTKYIEGIGGRKIDQVIMKKLLNEFYQKAAVEEYKKFGDCLKDNKNDGKSTKIENSDERPICKKLVSSSIVCGTLQKAAQAAKEMLSVTTEYHGSLDDLIPEFPDYRYEQI
ncbi:MAG: hypothetical protein EZS28_014467 [Streblomastix strix]|uniref:Uncharacterized protein n=1 Tax=Streblomastix strix TaxID=222440 RepID=A0A5J4W559_9EUKA|nr:MAG: hypothetical protein EZS28_014467 [Streblomastix strix]